MKSKSGVNSFWIIPVFGIGLHVRILCFSFKIAVSLQSLCEKIQSFNENLKAYPATTATTQINCIINEIKAQKCSLSPLLFIIFSSDCLTIINLSLNIAFAINSTVNNNKYGVLPMLLHLCWEIFYLAFIVDRTMESYKSLAGTVR